MNPDGSGYTSFSDLFKLGREVLKTETFVLHEAQTRASPSKRALVKCLFIFGLTKTERAQVGDDVRTFRKAKHSCILALQDVISEPEVSSNRPMRPPATVVDIIPDQLLWLHAWACLRLPRGTPYYGWCPNKCATLTSRPTFGARVVPVGAWIGFGIDRHTRGSMCNQTTYVG